MNFRLIFSKRFKILLELFLNACKLIEHAFSENLNNRQRYLIIIKNQNYWTLLFYCFLDNQNYPLVFIQLVFCFADSALTHHRHLLFCWKLASGKHTAILRCSCMTIGCCSCMPTGCCSHNCRNFNLLGISRDQDTLDMVQHFDSCLQKYFVFDTNSYRWNQMKTVVIIVSLASYLAFMQLKYSSRMNNRYWNSSMTLAIFKLVLNNFTLLHWGFRKLLKR